MKHPTSILFSLCGHRCGANGLQ